MYSEYIPVQFRGVYVDPASSVPVMFFISLDEEDVLPVWIGVLEAQSIVMAWKRMPSVRPMTHDILAAVIREDLYGTVLRVEINSMHADTYYASIILQDVEGNERSRDARPSDAIALALRTDAPIIIHSDVFRAARGNPLDARAFLQYVESESAGI